MKKSTKILLIIASIMLVTGVAICVSVFMFVGVDSFIDSDGDYQKATATFDEAETVDIESVSADVVIRTASSDEVRVEYPVGKKFEYTVTCDGGKLSVTGLDKRNWYDFIGIFVSDNNNRIVVDLPEKIYESLVVNSASGDIDAKTAPEALTCAFSAVSGDINANAVCRDLVITVTSGEIRINGNVTGNSTMSTVSGSVNVGGTYGDVKITSVSGEIKAADIKASDMTLETGSGDITFSKAQLSGIKLSGISGEVELSDTAVENTIDVDLTSGDLVLSRVDATDYNIDTVSGDISGTIISNKYFDVSTVSGDVDYPKFMEAEGKFIANTTSGDVYISLSE